MIGINSCISVGIELQDINWQELGSDVVFPLMPTDVSKTSLINPRPPEYLRVEPTLLDN